MVKGVFKYLNHDHHFSEIEGMTVMKDVFSFSAPFGLIGRIAEVIFLTSYLRRFLIHRNSAIKRAAETEDWGKFVHRDRLKTRP